MAESVIRTVRMPRLGIGVQPPNPFPFLDALEQSPPTTSTFQRTDPAPEERALEMCLVRRSLSGGAERYSGVAMTC